MPSTSDLKSISGFSRSMSCLLGAAFILVAGNVRAQQPAQAEQAFSFDVYGGSDPGRMRYLGYPQHAWT